MLDFNRLPRFKPFGFQIVLRTPEWAHVYQVTEEEIERQIGIAHAWWQNNPQRGPKKDVLRFLHNFLSIVERRGAWRRKPPELYKDTPPPEDMSVSEMISIRKRNMGQA